MQNTSSVVSSATLVGTRKSISYCGSLILVSKSLILRVICVYSEMWPEILVLGTSGPQKVLYVSVLVGTSALHFVTSVAMPVDGYLYRLVWSPNP